MKIITKLVRELIEILLKGWRLIAIITVICLLSSGIFSFFIQEPIYEAKTILMTSDMRAMLANLKGDKEDIALGLLATYPIMTLQTYKEQIKNPQLLQEVVEELKLKEYGINSSNLVGIIDLNNIPDTNLLAISVTHKEPKLAADIANTLANKNTKFITNMSRQQSSKALQLLIGQLEVELNKVRAGLTTAEQELKNTPLLIVTNKSVGQDPLLNQILAETNGTSVKDAAQLTMKSEEVNEGYVELRSKVSEYKIDVSKLDALISRYEEARITESTEIVDSTINIISQAFVPESPIGYSKALNLAIAGVLGMMIGVYFTFFKHYWKTSGNQIETSK